MNRKKYNSLVFIFLCSNLFFQSCSISVDEPIFSASNSSLRKQLAKSIELIPWTEPVPFDEPDIMWSSFNSRIEEIVFMGSQTPILPKIAYLGKFSVENDFGDVASIADDFFENLCNGDLAETFKGSNFDLIKTVLFQKSDIFPFDKFVSSNPVALANNSFQIDALFFKDKRTFLMTLFVERIEDNIVFQDFYFEELENDGGEK